jgi:hypothetical protein
MQRKEISELGFRISDVGHRLTQIHTDQTEDGLLNSFLLFSLIRVNLR